MKKVAWVFTGILLAGPACAEDINKRVDADANGMVEIYNTAGSVIVQGWSQRAVEVTGTLGNEVDEFIFERDGDEVLVKLKPKHGRSGHRGYESNITVRVPEGSSLEIATVSADIDVSKVNGDQELQSVSGEIETESAARQLEVETVSGDIDVQGNGEASESELVSVSGSISATGMAGIADLESVNGRVSLGSGMFSEVSFETVNGRIEFEGSLSRDGELDIETVNGRITVDFIGDVNAEFDIETFNGRIKNCFGPSAERVSKYAPGWELRFTEGAGDGSVMIESLNGSVSICKS